MNQLINTTQPNDEIIDISLSSIRKKRFRIDGDDSRILELDVTDLSIVGRLQTMYNKLLNVVDTAFKDIPEEPDNIDEIGINDNYVTDVIKSMENIDKEIRTIMDDIFDSNVSDICAPSGSMLDPINGKFRFEHIFDCLIPLYEKEITSEMTKFNARVQKHTSKYIKGK